jgi:hypothetical protein
MIGAHCRQCGYEIEQKLSFEVVESDVESVPRHDVISDCKKVNRYVDDPYSITEPHHIVVIFPSFWPNKNQRNAKQFKQQSQSDEN